MPFCNLFFNKAYRPYFLINFQGSINLQENRTKQKIFNGCPSLLRNFPAIAKGLLHLALAAGLPRNFYPSLYSPLITDLPLLISFLSSPQLKAVIKQPALTPRSAWQNIEFSSFPTWFLFSSISFFFVGPLGAQEIGRTFIGLREELDS